jgi:hypothetical protein
VKRKSLFIIVLFSTTILFSADAPSIKHRVIDFAAQPLSTTAPLGAISGTVQCDAATNIFMRYVPVNGSAFSTAITRITSTGSSQEIRYLPIPEYEGDQYTFAFAVDRGGLIHRLVQANSGKDDTSKPVVLQYAADGSVKFRSELALPVIASMFVPFSNGDYFVGGSVLKKVDGELTVVPLMAIFSGDGSLKSMIRSNEDIEANSSGKPEDMGVARLADDGSVYVLQWEKKTRVQIISPVGRVLRSLNLDDPGPGLTVVDLFVSSGRILVMYTSSETPVFHYALFDSETGHLISTYEPRFKGIPACFADGHVLTVLTPRTSNGTFALGSVDLR